MEDLQITISNPFEMDYRTSTASLTLTHVSLTGQRAQIHFDAEATQALCELLGQAIQANGGLLGKKSSVDLKKSQH